MDDETSLLHQILSDMMKRKTRGDQTSVVALKEHEQKQKIKSKQQRGQNHAKKDRILLQFPSHEVMFQLLPLLSKQSLQ